MKKNNPLYTYELPKISEMFSRKEIIALIVLTLVLIAGVFMWDSNIWYVLPVAVMLFQWLRR